MPLLLLRTILFAAIYGFSAGLVHSMGGGLRNVVKFPLLILITSAVCAVAWWICIVFITKGASFGAVQRISLRTFHDIAALLASLAPVTTFLAVTIEKPLSEELLNEYPFFLGLNVLLIALCGTLALARQALTLVRDQGLSVRIGAVVMVSWLAVSLVAGGQCAWFFRPYYGLACQQDTPFMLGTTPDFRGATNFFEAVAHLVDPPHRSTWPDD